jgi:putative methionine-R-sulfoxide reductase with GAF domain
MSLLFQDTEKRSCARFPFFSPIHLIADTGQIIIGTTQNIGTNGLLAQISRSLQRDTSVMFKFSHEKTSAGGYGRVVWSGSHERNNLCGIAFLKMKQKDKDSLKEILEYIDSPRCLVCHSKIEMNKLTPYFERQFSKKITDDESTSLFIEIAHLLNSTLTFGARMERTLTVVKNHFHAKAVGLFLYNEDRGRLELSYHAGFQSIEESFPDLEKGLGDQALWERKRIFIPDVQKDPSFLYKDQARPAGIRSIAVIPLISEEKAFGILAICIPLHGQRETFGKEEKEVFSAIGNLVALGMKMHLRADLKMASAL